MSNPIHNILQIKKDNKVELATNSNHQVSSISESKNTSTSQGASTQKCKGCACGLSANGCNGSHSRLKQNLNIGNSNPVSSQQAIMLNNAAAANIYNTLYTGPIIATASTTVDDSSS